MVCVDTRLFLPRHAVGWKCKVFINSHQLQVREFMFMFITCGGKLQIVGKVHGVPFAVRHHLLVDVSVFVDGFDVAKVSERFVDVEAHGGA